MSKLILGIELGSTRIKSVLVDESSALIAQGAYEWENVLVDGLWSYPENKVWEGLRESYACLAGDYRKKYGSELTYIDALGISGMMHGYLAFDENDNLLAPFRTWRNTNTKAAAEELSALFDFNVPMRWSVSQYYQSVLDGLSHIKNIAHLNTLAGYVHYRLTGKRVLGICDASGMFPVDGREYDKTMLESFSALLKKKGIETDFKSLLPEILVAGENAGTLTESGARILDPSGKLRAGCVMCPPEGDMGTGMVATNSVCPRSANISAGTSVNLCVILDKKPEKYHMEIDVLASPEGHPAALVHANNCTSEINAWVNLIFEAVRLAGSDISKGELFEKLFEKSLESSPDTGKLVSYNYFSGETITDVERGIPLTARMPEGTLNLANFMQAQIYSALATLAVGMKILHGEGAEIDAIYGHGGFYKTEFVGQNATSACLGAPVTVLKNAGEGGAFGIALLALYTYSGNGTLSELLDSIFARSEKTTVCADETERKKFADFLALYEKGLAVERLASGLL